MSYGRFNEKEFYALTRDYSRARGETRCGRGSTMASTKAIREVLPIWFRRYSISTLCDAGAGDRHWSQHLDLEGVTYLGFDLLPRYEGIIQLDITQEFLPLCDAILCRHVLNHLTTEMIDEALANFKLSGKYLIANTYDHNRVKNHPFGTWMCWDLKDRLGKPVEFTPDVEGDLAIWSLK